MNFSPILFFASLMFFVLCEKCSETLRETFNKSFNLRELCEDCVILNPGIYFQKENWAGFCIGNEFFLFKNWKCRDDDDFLKCFDSLAIVTNKSCEIIEGSYYDLNKECLKKFNDEIRNAPMIWKRQDNKGKPDKISFRRSFDMKGSTSGDKTYDPILFRRRSTGFTKISTTTTSTEETSDETTSTKETSVKTTTTKQTNPTEKITTWSSSTSTNLISKTPAEYKNLCESNEFFFNDHCYFIMVFNENYNGFPNLTEKNSNKEEKSIDIINITKKCQNRNPNALGLAVETVEENNAVFRFLKTLRFYNNCAIFTSGFRMKGEDEWKGWNLKLNRTLLNIRDNDIKTDSGFYCINACKNYWYLLNSTSVPLTSNFYVICERPYNPKNIQPELHELCLKLYRKSNCYNLEKHSKYCCEKDDKGDIFFACPCETFRKIYSNRIECSWTCSSEGFFYRDRPTCKGTFFCYESYNKITYVAPSKRYAIGNCPRNSWGHSTWYCGPNKTFLGKPDFSLCCNGTNLSCRNTDIFLNAWMGCPLTTVVKKTSCPPGTILKEALAEWYCQENGTFKGNTPDYSKCNFSKVKCMKKDRYGREWEGAIGAVSVKNCPPSFTGKCFWKCKKSGVFDGPEPDCSKCRAKWMEDIENKIKNHSNHEEVMKIMENYTKTEDLRIGYGHVLNLTSGCVALFKKQTSDSKLSTFDNFLKSYSKILKNVAGNPNVWSSFSESNREEFSDQVLETTEDAAFAKLSSKNISGQKYNTTLANFRTDGFDFFVAYNLSVGSQFPLDKIQDKNWHLDVKKIKESSSSFAAMGLVMNYTLSSLMFPNKNDDLKVNAPALTFKVATYKNGEVVAQPDVVVSISFKHINKTRLPATRIIKRRLHKGEEPSGVFNSTLCYYFRNSTWTTEGCYVTFTSKERTNCTCTHLSTIGLLMAIHEYQPNNTLEVVSTISSAITIVSLFLALLVFCFFENVKNDRVLIGQNLCLCLLIGHTMLITVMDKKFFNIPDNFCTIFGILLHYVFMAAFAWMLVEGCHLYRMLVLVFDSDVEYRWIYLSFGYGAPFIVVGATQLIGFLLREQPYGQDELCWLKPPKYVWAFVGPVLVTTLINFCILVTAMKLAISSKRRTEKSNFGTLKLWIKGWISLSSLLGITWLFGFFYIYQNELFAYTFVVFNGLQGFFIFLFRCVLSEHYQNIFWKKIKHRFFNFKSKDRKKSENIKSETKLYAISGSKSLSGEMETRDSGYEPGLDGIENKQNTNLKSRREKENSPTVGVNINVTLKPEISEAYLRNKMIARNFSVRKSKKKWLADDFPELSFHDIHKHKPN